VSDNLAGMSNRRESWEPATQDLPHTAPPGQDGPVVPPPPAGTIEFFEPGGPSSEQQIRLGLVQAAATAVRVRTPQVMPKRSSRSGANAPRITSCQNGRRT
jgi:hypothetical protein